MTGRRSRYADRGSAAIDARSQRAPTLPRKRRTPDDKSEMPTTSPKCAIRCSRPGGYSSRSACRTESGPANPIAASRQALRVPRLSRATNVIDLFQRVAILIVTATNLLCVPAKLRNFRRPRRFRSLAFGDFGRTNEVVFNANDRPAGEWRQ